MDLSPYADTLRRDLLRVAEAGGPEVRDAIERVTHAIEPAARLALMEAIGQAAAEISAELPDASVEVRLDGRDLGFVLQHLAPEQPTAPSRPSTTEPEATTDAGQARVSLRLPEPLKARAEEEAAQAGQSLNTWLVAAVRAATGSASGPTDPTPSSFSPPPLGDRPTSGPRRLTGWL
ncbi:toxin-antitoxin system HicB family antitoxin [Nocardioides insulae]|uniref:toxin-antitoxin system HicB family antitoxin n=1 Tax=Nocardioides insulae TaxID=394734 RepID=UPI0004143878|nr:toxin-antitoxin system HicB family antitoxin [Nocardioides insulae]